MSLEKKIEELTEVVQNLTKALKVFQDGINTTGIGINYISNSPDNGNTSHIAGLDCSKPVIPPIVAPKIIPGDIPPVTISTLPLITAPTPPTASMFEAPAVPIVEQEMRRVAPFTDAKGLINYVMDTYRTLGPHKGAEIQKVLAALDYQNINDVKPEHYNQLFTGIEALK